MGANSETCALGYLLGLHILRPVLRERGHPRLAYESYNSEKDRVTIEETFRHLTELMAELDAEQKRAVEEGLSEEELALFDLLKNDRLSRADREKAKQASRELLSAITGRLAEFDRFWEKEQTKAEVEVFILDQVYTRLPTPPFSPEEKKLVAELVYGHVWQQAVSNRFAEVA